MPEIPQHERFSFDLAPFTPNTLPMHRLSDYLADLAILLGSENEVHFVRVGKGSAKLIHDIEFKAASKVRERLISVKTKQGPEAAMKAYARINLKLSEDNGKATIRIAKGNVLIFPGKPLGDDDVIGPISQHDSLDGELIRVGGTDDTVPVHLREGDVIHRCTASVDLARRLGPLLYRTIRVSGIAQWYRRSTGTWEMQQFIIESFSGLDDTPLPEVVRQLRSIRADWVDDPIGFIKESRSSS